MWFPLLLFLLFSCDQLLAISKEKMDEILGENQRGKDIDLLRARAYNPRRKHLPISGDIFTGLRVDKMTCGTSYAMTYRGYIYFKLEAKAGPCYHEFIGSRTEKCTVGFMCRGSGGGALTLGRAGAKGACVKDRLVILDGTEGSMTGCGKFSFKDTPRTARNGGTDLYVTYSGISDATCLAFCVQDIKKENTGVKPAKPISVKKGFKGLKTEDSCTCGKRSDFGRIVGGQTAVKYEFPWIGAVVFKGAGYGRKPFCGGSLVNDRYFISAAHCFAIDGIEGDEVEVILHAHVMDKRPARNHPNPRDPIYNDIPGWDLPIESDDSENSLRMEVEEIKNHPLFNKNTFDFDIAIMKFKKPLSLTDGKVGTICLPKVTDKVNLKDGDTLTVAGWGRPDENAPTGARVLQKLDVPFMNLESCKKFTPAANRHLCAGYIEGGKDACAGDSGGPLIHQFNRATKQYMLSGVVSAGNGCARENNEGLYTFVPELVQWVYHHISDDKAMWCKRD